MPPQNPYGYGQHPGYGPPNQWGVGNPNVPSMLSAPGMPAGFRPPPPPPPPGPYNGDLAAVLDQLRQSQDGLAHALMEVLTELKESRKGRQGVVPRFIEDIPGKRVPYTWVITAPFTSAISNQTRVSGNATLSEDGPFVITQYTPLWQVTTISASNSDASIENAFLPPGRLPFLIRNVGGALPAMPCDIIDFTIALQLSGGDRLWQNTDAPAIKYYDAQTSSTYVGIPGLVERNETMTVSVTAQTSGTATDAPGAAARGTFWWVMDGYKILRPIDYAEAQGWTR